MGFVRIVGFYFCKNVFYKKNNESDHAKINKF